MIFKRKSRLIFMVCVILACTTFIAASAATAGQPGSDADPLVSKSYVDKQIALLAAQIGSGTGTQTGGTGTVDSAVIAQLQTDVGDLTKFIMDALDENEALKNRVAALENGFVVVEAKAGKKILLSGGTEAILRSGTAVAMKGSSGDLVLDASAGANLKDGANVPTQHILISSRADGRGLLIKTNAFLIIRGSYTIQ